MKELITILICFAVMLVAAFMIDSEYQRGFKDGHCDGWRYVKGEYSVCPVTPVTPVPKSDCTSGYKCGYSMGFARGSNDAEDE